MTGHYSFVVGAGGHFGYQAYLLARSLIENARVPPSAIAAFLVRGADSAAEEALRSLGLRTEWVEPFGHVYCNKLQQLDALLEVDAEQLVLLDTDMFAMRELPLPPASAIWGKIVDAPRPPLDEVRRIFEHAGVRLRQAVADVVREPTATANFNGGLYVIPKPLLPALAEAWPRWARWSNDHAELYGDWLDNVDQLSFALAASELDLPVDYLRREYNTPTHMPGVTVDEAPFLLHYHRNVDDQLMLRPTGHHRIDEAVGAANAAIVRWRRDDLQNPLFWSARYSLFSELGSGVGSRGDVLSAKRVAIGRLIEILRPASVVDIGGGDGASLEGLAGNRDHVFTDVSAAAADLYRSRNPQARFVRADITQRAAEPADLAVGLDVLIHIPDGAAYRRAVANMITSGRNATVMSGFDGRPGRPGTLTYFHEPLLDTIESDPDSVAYPVLAYHEVVAYAIQRGGGTGHPRDARPATLRRAMPLTPDPLVLLECVARSRRELGFFPDHVARAIEYPWVLQQIRALGGSRRILDIGTGVNVLPLALADDGHDVTTVDNHQVDRSAQDRSEWNEWGYLDYSALAPGIRSHRVDYLEYGDGEAFDVIYSVSVIEHLPAQARRRWLRRMASHLAPGGRLYLTVDLVPNSRSLWLLSEGVQVEAAAEHGDLDTVLGELRGAGFETLSVDTRPWLPSSRVGIALIAAQLKTAPLPSGTASRDHQASETGARVTLCVAAYRPAARFSALLDSLERQTMTDFVVHVSLDHAPGHAPPPFPDGLRSRVRIIEQPVRLGFVGNVNAVMQTVRTPYFVALMHDDQLSPTFLAQAVAVLERQPEVVVAHGALRHHGIRDGELLTQPSFTGDRVERLAAAIAAGVDSSGLGQRGVVRSWLIERGLRLRTRRSDGMFATDLFAMEMLVHGESAFVPDICYDKYTDPDGLSRAYHGRPLEERSRMLADNLACFVDVLVENDFAEADREELAARYAAWLISFQSNWSVVADTPNPNGLTFAEVRPAVGRFAANVALSAAAPRSAAAPATNTERAAHEADRPADSGPPPESVLPGGRPSRSRLVSAARRHLVRLPHPFRTNPLFDPDWYVRRYPDVQSSKTPPYRHYWRHGISEGRDPNELFDTDWYLARYPDVRDEGLDPLDHYLLFGAREGRDPGPEFDTDWYVQQYPDVRASGVNPLLHFLRHGRGEGRSSRRP